MRVIETCRRELVDSDDVSDNTFAVAVVTRCSQSSLSVLEPSELEVAETSSINVKEEENKGSCPGGGGGGVEKVVVTKRHHFLLYEDFPGQ